MRACSRVSLCLVEHAGDADRGGEQHARGDGDSHAMPAHEAIHAVCARAGAGRDWLVAAVSRQVFGKRLHRAVAFARCLAQGPMDDVFEIVAEQPLQSLWRNAAQRRGFLVHPAGRATQGFGFIVEYGVLHLCPRCLVAEGPPAREQ